LSVLGIDPGLATVGYAVIEKREGIFYPLTYGVITTPAGVNLSKRLLSIQKDLSAIITEFKPDEAAIETLYFSKNKKTAMDVAHARGVLLLTLANHNLPISEYTPNVIKQTVTGSGRSEKFQVQNMVKLLLGMDDIVKPDDAADALAIAICHKNHSPAMM